MSPFSESGVVWKNGRLIPWKDATIHLASHVVHYGSCLFEGLRAYDTAKGTAIFRLQDHTRRLYNSCKIYRMEVPYSQDEFNRAVVECVRANGLKACYVRPIVYRGYGTLGVNPFPNPVDCAVLVWEWGQYLGPEAMENGVDVCVSSWWRMAPNTFPALAKAGANYMNSQLIKMEALLDGYEEGIALNIRGHISEGSGENLFLVKDGVVLTPPLVVLGPAGHHPGLGHDPVPGDGHQGRRGDHPARDALHRRRGLLHGLGRRGHAHPLDRQDRHRDGQAGAPDGEGPEGLFRDRGRQDGRHPRLADVRLIARTRRNAWSSMNS